jgi:hypothetical protein
MKCLYFPEDVRGKEYYWKRQDKEEARARSRKPLRAPSPSPVIQPRTYKKKSYFQKKVRDPFMKHVRDPLKKHVRDPLIRFADSIPFIHKRLEKLRERKASGKSIFKIPRKVTNALAKVRDSVILGPNASNTPVAPEDCYILA